MAKSYKVLFDLSTVVHSKNQFAGIPQETRVLFKTLSETEKLTPIGFMCGMEPAALFSKMNRTDKVQEAITHANLILNFEERLPRFKSKWMNYAVRYAAKTKALFKRNHAIWKYDSFYNDYVWRKAFCNFIETEYKQLILDQEFVISDFNKWSLLTRIYANMRLPYLNTKGYDFVIFQQGFPACPNVSKKTIPIVRFHDAVPLHYPDTIAHSRYPKMHGKSILSSAKQAIFVCNSKPVHDELLQLIPSLEKKSFVIPPPILTEGVLPEKNNKAISSIIRSRLSKFSLTQIHSENLNAEYSNYILAVSTLEPRKNFISLIRAWERLNYSRDDQLKLVIIGSPGWKYKSILQAMKPHIKTGKLIHLEHVPVYELKMIYACARTLVFPTYYEGFGSTTLEALQAGCPVITSDIPVCRWVLEDAALYCDPYDVMSITNAIEKLLYSSESELLKDQLMQKSKRILQKFSSEKIGQQWVELFQQLNRDR